MKVLMITGSRGWTDYERILDILSEFSPREWVVIHGAARGADTLAAKAAKAAGFIVEAYPAEWDKKGRSAGIQRNEKLAGVADRCIAFWDGKSPGTRHAISAARRRNVPTKVYVSTET